MANPTATLNNVTGTDTAASGAGPSTALSGTGAATAANTTVNLSVDNPNLSGVAVDGSALMWVKSSSGRQFSKISAVDNVLKTVTVASAYANTESGRTWGIGGKRKDLSNADTQRLFVDGGDDWRVALEDTGTLYSLTAVLNVSVSASAGHYFWIEGASAARTGITTATNSINLINIGSGGRIVFRHLAFTNTAATKGTSSANGRAIVPATGSGNARIEDCTFDGFYTALDGENATYSSWAEMAIVASEVVNSVGDGVRQQNRLVIDKSNIRNNGGDGVNRPTNASNDLVSITNTALTGNAGRGYLEKATGALSNLHVILTGNTASHNGAPGVELRPVSYFLLHGDNSYYGNTTNSIKVGANGALDSLVSYNNAYEAGTMSGIDPAAGDVTVTVDPRKSSTDYGINNLAGGGPLLRNAAASAPNVSANPPGDIGAVPTGGGVAGCVPYLAAIGCGCG